MRPNKRAKHARPGRGRADGMRRERRTPHRDDETEPYDWAVDVAGEVELRGQRLLLSNRAAQKIRAPLRLS